jgi:hypothetical protein
MGRHDEKPTKKQKKKQYKTKQTMSFKRDEKHHDDIREEKT